MELINKLIVKDFPGLPDGTFEFSQDTIIQGGLGSGKTSILKAITWLLTEKDLKGKTIPNIKDTTKVITRGFMEMVRDKSGLHGDIQRILKGSAEHILARIIPGYIFSAGLTNKKIVEIMCNIKMDTFSAGGTNNLEFYTKEIKGMKQYQDSLLNISNKVYQCNDSIRNQLSKYTLHILPDVPKLLEYEKHINKAVEVTDSIMRSYEKSQVITESGLRDIANVKLNAEALTIIDSFKKDTTNEGFTITMEGLIKQYTGNDMTPIVSMSYMINKLRTIKNKLNNTLSSVEMYLQTHFKEITRESIEYYYFQLIQRTLELSRLMNDKQKLIKRMYQDINDKINRYGMTINGNNILTVKVRHEGKDLSLDELPRHVRYLMEISLCSRLQLDYIGGRMGRNNETTGLILIDDYFLPIEDDTIDSVLIEALSHQVILTKLNLKLKGLEITT